MPVVVSVNRFLDDPDSELVEIRRSLLDHDVPAVITDYREGGGQGGIELAEAVREQCATSSELRYQYALEAPLREKIEAVATKIYRASNVEFTQQARQELGRLEDLGYGGLPICVAKTPASFSDNPKLAGRPRDFSITVTSAKVSAGAGFVVVYTGKVMTMPGLPKVPAARGIDVDADGNISGLF
jgi:formate--tetrahydrofolate ligase